MVVRGRAARDSHARILRARPVLPSLTMTRRRPFVIALGVLPLLVDWIYKALVHPRPFWAFYFDPELIYVQEGLRLLSGRAPV
jgi:hypothetical protein